MNTTFTSFFKIDGLPILPPLMTEAVRMEMRQYRSQAIKLEERLKHMKELERGNSNTSVLEVTQENPDDALGYVTCKSFGSISDCVPEVEAVSNDRESPWFVPASEDRKTSRGSDDLVLEELASNLSISERSIPLEEVNGIAKSASEILKLLPENNEQEEMPLPRLVRSNSYTLDGPSPHLVDLLKPPTVKSLPNRVPPTKSPVDLRKVKSKVDSRLVFSKSKKLAPKIGSRKLSGSTSCTQNCKYPRSSSALGKMKSLRGAKKVGQKIKPKDDVKTVSPEQAKKPPETSIPQNQTDISEFLSKIEAEHKVRMQELLEIQLEEQRKLRENFNEQQKLLVESLRKTFPEVATPQDSNGNDTTATSLTLDGGDSEWTNGDCESLPMLSTRAPKSQRNSLDHVTQIFLKQHLTQVRQEVDPLSPRSAKAASVINAHVRGYLVRRLLRTEAVQQIIQTFHDTRLFLIELHRDSQNKNSNPTDIELKRRLLQQLSSSLGSLHGVFFQLPVSERMDIIAKDRENLRLRLQRATERRFLDSRKSQQQMSKMKIVTL
uniref:Centriolar coiled-coil protein of 110 kDa n=1 Tax=Lutzomyia longipalpis TaxID=7200 RepID=A0A1B0CET0_LUTLO